MTPLVVLISGTGRNLEAIIQAQQSGQIAGTIKAVISNNPDAVGLQYARSADIPTVIVNHRDFPDRNRFDSALSDAIETYSPAYIALAGFMRILGSEFVQRYRGRLLNIHPSLLPQYPGLNTHARALADGQTWHGASIHFVTEAVDGGPVILQGRVRVHSNDSSASLAERVMHEVEQRIYPQALAWACAGRLAMQGDRVVLDGRPLAQPVRLEDISKEQTGG